MHTILFKFKTAYSLVLSGTYNCFKFILPITQSHLSIAQNSFSIKHPDMCTFMYATPTFITEALCLVTQLQLLLMTVTVN